MSPSPPSERVEQQAGVIPFRGSGRNLEICLIRRKASNKRWGIPKGFVDPGETAQEAALKEAFEEAGLKGRLVGDPVGSYEYFKWDATLAVTVYLMEVDEEADEWDEAGFRERQWTTLARAIELLERHPVVSLVDSARARLS